jgi:hypothetical protein
MKTYFYKIGAVCYALWGLLHMVGAAVLLLQATGAGATAVFATIGSATPTAGLPQLSSRLADAVLGYYAWNLLWIGGFVLVVAVKFNWQNHRLGYWLNLAVVSAVDLGLIVFLLVPAHMALTDGLLGVVLWLPALLFSTIGQPVRRTAPVGSIVPA